MGPLGSAGISCKQGQQNTKVDHSTGGDSLLGGRVRAASESTEQQPGGKARGLYMAVRRVRVFELMQAVRLHGNSMHFAPVS